MLEEKRFGDAGLFRQFAGRGPVEAFFGKYLLDRLDDGGSTFFADAG